MKYATIEGIDARQVAVSKERIMGFEGVRGQERAIAVLRSALSKGRLAHACLFVGPDGVGKAMTARLLARALLCKEDGGDVPCGRCAGCRKAEHGIHPDWLVLESASGTRGIKIEEVREVQRNLSYRPYEGGNRVILVLEAERMTIEAANALLKSLEEPPEATYFILVSAMPHLMLTTIKSRCQKIHFAPLGIDVTVELIRQNRADVPESEARAAAALAGGSVGLALGLLEAGLLDARKETLQRIASLSPYNPADLIALAEEWTSGGGRKAGQDRHMLVERLKILSAWLRDILMVRAGMPESSLINSDLAAELKEQAAGISSHEVLRILDVLRDANKALVTVNANAKMTAEALLALLAAGNRARTNLSRIVSGSTGGAARG